MEPYFEFAEDSDTLLVSFNVLKHFQLVSWVNGKIVVYKMGEDQLPQLNITDDNVSTYVRALHILNARIQSSEEESIYSNQFKDDDGNPLSTKHRPWILMVDNQLRLQIRSI